MMILWFLHDEEASTAIEYSLIAALVGVGIIGGLITFGQALNTKFAFVGETVDPVFGT